MIVLVIPLLLWIGTMYYERTVKSFAYYNLLVYVLSYLQQWDFWNDLARTDQIVLPDIQ